MWYMRKHSRQLGGIDIEAAVKIPDGGQPAAANAAAHHAISLRPLDVQVSTDDSGGTSVTVTVSGTPGAVVDLSVRRVLRHPALNTQAKRMGAVVRASASGLRVWRQNEAEQLLAWP